MAAKKSSHLFIAIVVDACLVALFTIVGHYTHHQSLVPEQILSTAWPFLAGLVIAWLLNAVWAAPLAPLRTGTGLWATTVLLGLVIRALTGEGTEGPFIVVAASLNLVTLVGWRVIATAVAGRSAR
ncbi:DUF3054 domain-containing protein [Brevibacterium sp. p3-SID960]|uniref:DUF3054 domain-containing protein n=1 Tax=Brevibacterium sp. p3-SID960 TaxID=2916063 RepID=UPI0021A4F835|nr:DUF3054 domain-containing protein [Brevibacterium sp. p3-SID960]MCT1690415.1 DUF3054 domain-containing protein [Brevibacterium sp. p3-SID960]